MQPTTIPVDLNSWSRRDYFYYFTKMMPTGFNVNVDVDITATYDADRAADYHFFPAYLYLVTKVIQGQPEFMMVMQDGRLAQFTELTPSYSLFHDDDHSIRGCGQTTIQTFKFSTKIISMMSLLISTNRGPLVNQISQKILI